MNKLLPLLLPPLLLAGCGESQLKSRDVVGVQLGMTPSEAHAALIKHNPNLQFKTKLKDYSYRDGVLPADQTVSLSAYTPREAGGEENIHVAFLQPSRKAVSIIRSIRVGNGPDISSETYDAALKEKYGSPVINEATRDYPRVFGIGFDVDGKKSEKCINLFGDPTSVKPGCGDSLGVRYETRRPESSTLFGEYTIALVDAAAVSQEKAQEQSAQQAARDSEAQKAVNETNGTKPDL